MQKGDLVIVHAYPDEFLERIVWEEFPSYVEVCRQEVFEQAIISGTTPISVMGFPKEDVIVKPQADI